jgi:hypothetical protein
MNECNNDNAHAVPAPASCASRQAPWSRLLALPKLRRPRCGATSVSARMGLPAPPSISCLHPQATRSTLQQPAHTSKACPLTCAAPSSHKPRAAPASCLSHACSQLPSRAGTSLASFSRALQLRPPNPGSARTVQSAGCRLRRPRLPRPRLRLAGPAAPLEHTGAPSMPTCSSHPSHPRPSLSSRVRAQPRQPPRGAHAPSSSASGDAERRCRWCSRCTRCAIDPIALGIWLGGT